MTHAFNRDMLMVARAARGFTQGDLADAASVTQALISKIENGFILDPTPEMVSAFAHALKYPEEFFYSYEKPHGLPPFHFRKRASLGAKILAKIEADINIRRIHIDRLMRSFESHTARDFPTIDLDLNQWTPRDAARHVRGLWMIPRGPIEDLTAVVERAGAVVVQIDFATPKLDALSFRLPGKPPLIFMNSVVPGDRYRFSLAHELAHLIFHNHPETDETMEDEADEFAGELLTPGSEVRPYLAYATLPKYGRAKQYWKVSIKSLIVQASRLKVITPNLYTRLNVQYSKAGYGKFGEPFPIPVEKPSTLSRAISHHMQVLNYSPEEMAKLLMLTKEEFVSAYTERPRLRLVGRD
ncbi:MAG TPA: XRE family transcriptional regulator [Rhizomicrobium sp.]|nr:XRE family transcriptional regulator [Rhizomicrobium sp.]